MNEISVDKNVGCKKGCTCGAINQPSHCKAPPPQPVVGQRIDEANQAHRDALAQIQDEEGS